MRDYRTLLLAGTLLACAGCAGISLSDEVNELKTASGSFSESLRTLQSSRTPSIIATRRAAVVLALRNNDSVTFSDQCKVSAQRTQEGYDAAVEAHAEQYDAAEIDRAYRQIHSVGLCDIQGFSDLSLVQAGRLPPATGSIDAPPTIGEPDLESSSRALDRYVRALADLASNTSGKAHDDARNGVFSAGQGLITALGIPIAGPVVGLLGQIVASADQAARNERIAEYLRAYDAIMPHLMERLGHAGRHANLLLLTNHTVAASQLVASANAALNPPHPRNRRVIRPAPIDRLTTYDFYAARIAEQNIVIDGLRRVDPMRAARAFAAAHHALTEAYTSRRANLTSLSAGLQSLNEAASALRTAIDKAKED